MNDQLSDDRQVLSMKRKDNKEEYSAEEVARRTDAFAKRVLSMPPQPRTKNGTKANQLKKRGASEK